MVSSGPERPPVDGDLRRDRIAIEVRPEPTVDELDALIAALALWGPKAPLEPRAPTSRWAMAGRLDAHAGLNRRGRHGRERAGPGRGE